MHSSNIKHSKNKRQRLTEDIEKRVTESNSDESSEEQGSSSEEEEYSLQKINPEIPKTYLEKDSWARLIIILEQANLETYKTKRGVEIINCDDH